MTDLQTCPSNEALITALYGEAAAEELRRIDAHLAVCAACRDEWDGLRGVRSVLREWEAPDVALNFRVIADADVPVAPAQAPRSPLSIYATAGLAAAAVLVLGLAAGLANLNVRIDGSGVTFTTGSGGTTSASATTPPGGTQVVPASATPATASAQAPWKSELVALEQRLRNEMAARGAADPAAVSASTTSTRGSMPQQAVLETVRSMIDEAETRQQRAMAIRFNELMRDVDAQRRTDLVSIQNGMGVLEGRTAAEAARSQELMNYLVRVSQQQPPR